MKQEGVVGFVGAKRSLSGLDFLCISNLTEAGLATQDTSYSTHE